AIAVDRGPVLGIDEGPAAGGDHAVARRHLLQEHRPLDGAEVGFAVPGEDVGDRQMLALLDELVDVRRLPIEALGERARDCRLAGRHEPDEVHLVRLHAMSRSRVSKKSGYDIPTASAPSIVDGPVAASAAMEKDIAIR